MRGAAASESQDYSSLGAVCRDGVALIARAEAGPLAPDAELQRRYSLMEEAYAAGFGTCTEGTSASAQRSLPLLDRANAELRGVTARLRLFAPP